MAAPLALLDIADGVATITLNRPERHNALVPELLDDLIAAVRAASEADICALVLTGAGRSFSTGGDVAAFLEESGSDAGLHDYADRIVGRLNEAILALIDCPVPVIAAVNGPVTGGSAGLMFAADIVLMSEQAFLQPYYVEVGFAPDGGWTALLPERIGAARAVAIQALNRRIDAAEAKALGLASDVVAPERLGIAVADVCETLRGKERGSLSATRRLVRDPARRSDIAERLEAERAAFCDLVCRTDVRNRMNKFVARP